MADQAKNRAGKITIEKLAEMSQREFTAIREEMSGMKTELKVEIKNVHAELKEEIRDVRSAIDSSADRVVGAMKEYLGPFIRSLDQVLVDVEILKSKVK